MADLMNPDITGPEWAKLTVLERIARCHDFAREAMQMAQATHPHMTQKFRDLAAEWNLLAAEMENSGRHRG